MRRWMPVVALLLLTVSLAPFAQGQVSNPSVNLSGQWVIYLVRFGERFDPARVMLAQKGNSITGTLNELKLAGTIHGNIADLNLVRPDGKEFGKLKINLTGAELTGTLVRGTTETPLTMDRIAELNSPPQTHTFVPSSYSRVFTEAIAPVLHIKSGDTVRTTTVDARGDDEKGISRSLGGNPLTGPFYVDGALPGDTLAITINRLRLNRNSAASTSSIMPSALTPEYYRNAKTGGTPDGNWELDRDHGTASLTHPTPRLRDFKIELKPMVGCVGVAPGNSASFRTTWLGPWGGNMDYRGIQEGTTVYLPVATEGALLYLGDVHAEEGDGELNGDALETSADIDFTVRVIPRVSTSGPRAENSEYLMSMGIAGSLDSALKQATTQLIEWIESDYKLTPNEAAVVVGPSIQYDIAEVVDPQVNVVAKIKKSVLAQIPK